MFSVQMPTNPVDILAAGKRRIALNLKSPAGQRVFRQLCASSDVLVEPFRPGVMEKLGLGPDTLCADNRRLIYARLTGFGQTGPLAGRAGHDINYAAMSGVLSLLGRRDGPPHPPVNLLADMAGGGLMCALGICMALLERHRSGRGQVVDASMVEGTAYVSSWLTRSQTKLPVWGARRGANVLDGGRYYYDCYETSEPGRFMSVGALEPQFFAEFVRVLGLKQLQQHVDGEAENEQCARMVAERFRSKTQAEWTSLFAEVDACVFPVLDWQSAAENVQNASRGVYVDRKLTDGDLVAAPAPRLSRTPAVASAVRHADDEQWLEVLREVGVEGDEVRRLHEDGVLLLPTGSKL